MKQLAGLGLVVLIFFGIWAVFSSLSNNSLESTYREIARVWVQERSPTYVFDGSRLEYRDSKRVGETVFDVMFHFQSQQAGYGDRTEVVSAEVITPHEIVVRVAQNGEVTSAITDGIFDEMRGKMIEPEEGNGTGKTVSLYFYSSEDDIDEEGNVMCNADAVVATERVIDDYSIEKHLELLLEGPTTDDEAKGLSSEFPLEGVALESASLSDEGILTITLKDTENRTVGGSCRTGILAAQIVKTALSIPGVETVNIRPEEILQP